MIPVHDFKKQPIDGFRVVKLGARSPYDTTCPHRHNYIELFYFEKGGGVHEIDFESIPIADNSVHLVTAGRVHHVKRANDSNGYVILFKQDLIGSHSSVAEFLFELMCYDVKEYKPVFEFDSDVIINIRDAILAIAEESKKELHFTADFIISHLNLVLLNCLRTLNITGVKGNPNQALYREFRQLLQQNFKTIKKVKEYASLLHISERQLNEIVRERTGGSASTIIYNQIILEAKRLLNTASSIKETAYELNFDDPSHFSKFFKTQTGISPSEFAKVHS